MPWVEYEAKITEGDGGPVIAKQDILLKHVPWRRFHWEPGKDWEDCDWVARDHYLTKRELKEQFGKEPSSETVRDEEAERNGADKYAQGFRVTEIYHKPDRKVYVIGWDFDEPLEVREDKLGISGFFPCPCPMLANVKSRELVPMPDHAVFAKGYEYINRLVQRIHSITGQIKVAGFYDAQMSELSQIAHAEDGFYAPVSNLAERLANTNVSDFSKVIATLPIAERVSVVRELQSLLLAEKQRLDEASGIADVVRGATDPNETATAQKIKGQWAGLRLSRKSGEVSRCLRDAFRIMAEIMAEHFTPESWFLATGMQPDPQTLQVLKSDLARSLAIDVETDSTVAIEDAEEKEQRIEFLNYVTPFLEKMLPAINQGAMPGDLGKELLLFAIRSFKHGRQLEDAVEAAPGTMQQLQQITGQLQQSQMQAQQMGQQMQQLQGQLQQAQGQEGQIKLQTAQIKAQADQIKAGAAVQKSQMDMRRDAQRAQIDDLKARRDFAMARAGVPTTNVM